MPQQTYFILLHH